MVSMQELIEQRGLCFKKRMPASQFSYGSCQRLRGWLVQGKQQGIAWKLAEDD